MDTPRFVFAILVLAMLAGCSQPQKLTRPEREDCASKRAEAKRDAKAVAQGIREGWSRDKALDLNTATKDQVADSAGHDSR